MKWQFILRGIQPSYGSWTAGRGEPGDMQWTLEASPPLPHPATQHRHGRESLLKLARRCCAYDGGRIIIVEAGRVTHAVEWRDAGEQDPEASGVWYEKKLDARDFQSAVT